MKWYIHLQDGERYAVYDLQNAGSLDRDESIKIEGFYPGGHFAGGVSIYPLDDWTRGRDAEAWYRTRLYRIRVGDEAYATRLLDYVVDLRIGAVDPNTRPPTPPGGRVALLPDETSAVYPCGNFLSADLGMLFPKDQCDASDTDRQKSE